MTQSMTGVYAERYYKIMEYPAHNVGFAIKLKTVEAKMRIAKKTENWKRAFLLMELLEDFYTNEWCV